MTPKEKQLLLKDLCARLPYGVKVRISSESNGHLHQNTTILDIDNLHKYILDGGYYMYGNIYKIPCFQLLPYLRPMSSMTEEERSNLRAYCRTQEGIIYDIGVSGAINSPAIIDWLNKKGFDYRGLIEKGLALEAPEGMYKNE